MKQHYQAYEITCIPTLHVGRTTIICASEEDAIESYRRTYPHAQHVFAEAVEGCDE